MNGSNVREDVWTKIVLIRFDPHDVVILMNVCKFILRCLVDGHSYPVVRKYESFNSTGKNCQKMHLANTYTKSNWIYVCVFVPNELCNPRSFS